MHCKRSPSCTFADAWPPKARLGSSHTMQARMQLAKDWLLCSVQLDRACRLPE